jgi:hypothetical protein
MDEGFLLLAILFLVVGLFLLIVTDIAPPDLPRRARPRRGRVPKPAKVSELFKPQEPMFTRRGRLRVTSAQKRMAKRLGMKVKDYLKGQ